MDAKPNFVISNTGSSCLRYILNRHFYMLVAASAWLSKLANAGSQIVSINLLIKYCGTENYAVFSLLTGLSTWFMLGDLGLGYAMQNKVSERRALNSDYTIELIMGFSLGLSALVIFAIVSYNLSSVLGVRYLQQFTCLSLRNKGIYLATASLLLLATTFGAMIYKVWYAEQRGYIANTMAAIGSMSSLVGVWLVAHSQIPDKLFWSLIAYLTPPMLLPFSAGFGRLISALRSYKLIRGFDEYKTILTSAGRFWGLAAMSTFVLCVDMIVISQYLPTSQIVSYTITAKLFGLALTIYVAVLMALWPICSELCARGQWAEAINLAKKHIKWGMALIAAITLIFCALKAPILRIMAGRGNEPTIPLTFIILMGCYHAIRVWTDTYSMILQSSSRLRCFWLWVPMQGIINVSLQLLLAPRFGLVGVVVALIISFLVTVSWSLPAKVFALRVVE